MPDETTPAPVAEVKKPRAPKAAAKVVTPGKGSSEWWFALGGIALGSLMVVGGALIPGAQALLVAGPAVISAGIAGYQISRGIAKK